MSTQNSNSKNDSKGKKLYIQFPYSPAIEEQMSCLYQLLSEKDRRLYAATEALTEPVNNFWTLIEKNY